MRFSARICKGDGVRKCVVWDLDNTLWRGTLLDGEALTVAPGAEHVVRELDTRGILQSVASKNDHDAAWAALTSFGLSEYFVCPQIAWVNKSESLRRIASELRIGIDALAFVDDQPFERDEVHFSLPEVLTIDAAHIQGMLELPALQPGGVTDESRLRRRIYQADLERERAQQAFTGPRVEFLATLGTELKVRAAGEADLRRAEELTVRTNQLNTSGRTYSADELSALISSDDHTVLVAELEDRYGKSGIIGLVLIGTGPECWTVKLLILSCRVISRGIGGVVLSAILQDARRNGVRLRAEFVPSDRNRMMLVTYRFNGFVEVAKHAGTVVLEHPLDDIRPFPPYITVN
jgi:FkbH-like protein